MNFYGEDYSPAGKIKVPIDPEVLARDPYHCLLGLCRVVGLRYTVEQPRGPLGGWSVTLETADSWPGDFFGGLHPRNRGKRSFSTVGAATPLAGLTSSFEMAFRGLEESCQVWRRIVSDQPKYRNWFVEPDDEEPLTRLFLALKYGGVKL